MRVQKKFVVEWEGQKFQILRAMGENRRGCCKTKEDDV